MNCCHIVIFLTTFSAVQGYPIRRRRQAFNLGDLFGGGSGGLLGNLGNLAGGGSNGGLFGNLGGPPGSSNSFSGLLGGNGGPASGFLSTIEDILRGFDFGKFLNNFLGLGDGNGALTSLDNIIGGNNFGLPNVQNFNPTERLAPTTTPTTPKPINTPAAPGPAVPDILRGFDTSAFADLFGRPGSGQPKLPSPEEVLRKLAGGNGAFGNPNNPFF